MLNNTEDQDVGGVELEEEIILQVNNISIYFGGIQALNHVSFNVRQGQILGLIGPNGAGKTVLLNSINGVHRPHEGNIVFNGKEISGLPPHKIAPLGIARTFQQIELFKQMNVIDNTITGMHFRKKNNIFSGGLFWGPGKKEEIESRREAEEILDFLELYPYRKQIVGNLSFGIQKLVGMARALIMNPKVLLLDEIASGLNREEKEDLARFLLRIRYQKNLSIIWVEHDMEMITQIADRIICLSYGIKIAEGTPDQIVSNPKVTEAYLGSKSREHLQ
ncbi:MAG: ABC transporter ATP-binding protein [Thermodesulfobacteriota bacterium]|nr:ABC transporter ATP-binding protein [Thermodesulfobacteriota bacterium]